MTRHAQIRRSELKSTKRSSSSKRASTSFKVNASTEDDDDDFVPAQDSSLFRQQDGDAGVEAPGVLGKLVSNLPTLREKRARTIPNRIEALQKADINDQRRCESGTWTKRLS